MGARGKRATETQIRDFWKLFNQGYTAPDAGVAVGMSPSWGNAQRWSKEYKNFGENGAKWKLRMEGEALAGAKADDNLSDEAVLAKEDLVYFARRFFGVDLLPWQVESCEQIMTLLDSPHDEFLVINVPPGGGKSTLYTRILPCFLTVRDRAIRGLLGSATIGKATIFNDHLRHDFDRKVPLKATPRQIKAGMGVDAESTLGFDYGRFRPEDSGYTWTAKQFFVEQEEQFQGAAKEPTWSAMGRGGDQLGYRVDVAIWDDAWKPDSVRTAESREEYFRWWDEEVETRLEPGGLLVMVMQRMSPDDLSHHCLGKQLGELDFAVEDDELDILDDDREDGERPPEGRKYWHVKYKAYYEELDTGPASRRADSAPYPDGPLLSPRRISWQRCVNQMRNNPDAWQVVYQQEEISQASVLVKKVWVAGGTDPDTGELCPGVWDDDRMMGVLPNTVGDLTNVATADPSPSKYWSIQNWVYHEESNRRFLVDLIRQKMSADLFLDWNNDKQEFTGIMQDWQVRSQEQGTPITAWVVEANAAQKFLLDYEHVHRWMARHGVSIIPHTTHGQNKNTEGYGVQMLGPKWRYGQVRLPGAHTADSRINSLKLVEEVTRWPHGGTDDCVMAEWFFEANLEQLVVPDVANQPRLSRPSWASRAAPTGLARRALMRR